MVKVIALKSVVGVKINNGSEDWQSTRVSLTPTQTYDVGALTANNWIAQGVAIDYDTALANPQCPKIIRTTPIVMGGK